MGIEFECNTFMLSYMYAFMSNDPTCNGDFKIEFSSYVSDTKPTKSFLIYSRTFISKYFSLRYVEIN